MVAEPLVYFGWLRAVLILALLLFVNMTFDYAKIRVVMDDTRKTLRATLGSFRLVARNFRATAGTYLLVTVVLFVCLGAYRGASALVPRDRLGFLLAALVLQQAYVLSRVWTRLLYFSAQSEVYRALRPVVEEGPGAGI